MSNKKAPIFNIPPTESSLTPKIMWGCIAGGSPSFTTDMRIITSRKDYTNEPYLENFKQSIQSSTERVWIMDPYLFEPEGPKNTKHLNRNSQKSRCEAILDWFHLGLSASDIKILTKANANSPDVKEIIDCFEKRAIDINSETSNRGRNCQILINTNLINKFDYVHDRFAIVDNELWHFGATVGGFHSQVNAVSRGWDANSTKAIEFFELAWRVCNGN